MSRIVLNTSPLKVVNKGGFHRQTHKKVYQQINTALGPHNGARLGTQTTTQRVSGASYYIFECPACGKRNKRAEKSASYVTESRVAFLCNGCGRIVEMEKQAPTLPATESRIIQP
jgi:predicted RNA-binding Zn-ribbon protein involved in translation (DUF1610 family)